MEVKLRLHDALECQRLRASWVVLVWRGQAKGSCVQPLLDRSGRRNTIARQVRLYKTSCGVLYVGWVTHVKCETYSSVQ